MRLQREKAGACNEQREGCDMAGAGLEEAVPRDTALDENVRPEGGRRGTEFERRLAAGENEVAQVAEENSRPGRQFDQKSRNGHGLLDFAEGAGCGHGSYGRCRKRSWDSR
jgi:hypothetical protein